MKINKMTIYILGALLTTAGIILSAYMSDFFNNNEIKFDKAKLITEVVEQKKSLFDLKKEWEYQYSLIKKSADKIKLKYANESDTLKLKEEQIRQKKIKLSSLYKNKYSQNYKIKCKTIKKETETFLSIYTKSITSFAEYDRVDSHYDLDKLISDFSYLETQLKNKQNID